MNKKKLKRKVLAIAMIALLLISVGYAALETNLRINGTANIAATSWNVYFTNIQTTNGSVTPSVAPSVSGTNTTSLNYTITLEEPGDFYEFTVDVVNGGTINAKIAENGVSNTALTQAQDTYVNYTVTYADGTEISAGDKLAKAGTTVNSVAQDVKTVKVRVEYDSTITPEQLNAMGENDITLDLTFAMQYVQD